MLQHKYINVKGQNGVYHRLGLLALFGLLTSAGIGIIEPSSASAIASPTVTATFMDAVGTTSLQPGETYNSAGSFYIPVKISTEHAGSLSVSVNAATSALTGTKGQSNQIESVPTGSEYTVGQMENQWGYRWHLGDTINDAPNDDSRPKNYQQMPTTSTLLSTISVNSDSPVTKYLTLGFGVGVTGTTPADTYTNEVTVSVVATPRDLNIFSITYMQDMTADICKNTKTPTTKTISTSANINVGPDGVTPYTDLIDTDGSKQSLDNASDFVPQKELIDKRDGKKYTIRKLADGNCWMVSNLEFDLVPTSSKDVANGTTPSSAFSTNGTDKVTGQQITLTNADTDLNSITTWTPEVSAELYGTAGTVYLTQRNAGQGLGTNEIASATTTTLWDQNGKDGLRSFSSAAAYPNALYSAKTASTPSFGVTDSGSPWQRFGNLYNFTAVTLGSSTKITSANENAADSICPKGWRLPSNTGGDSFSNLLSIYSLPTVDTSKANSQANQLANFPLNFLRTGAYMGSDGASRNRTTQGVWRSITGGNNNGAYILNTIPDFIGAQYGSDRGNGFAIRCVARY